jgi:ZIP family zinc transporter
MRALHDILFFALYPAGAVLIGGVISLLRPPSPAARSAIQHFAAGVIFCAVATELLPDVLHRRMPAVTVGGFIFGVVMMLGMKRLAEQFGQKSLTQVSQPTSLILTLAVDIALDGVLIGVGFAAGQKQGLLLTIALTLEVLFLGLSGGAALKGAGASRTKVVAITLGFAGFLLAGAGAGALLLSGVSGTVLDAVLAFGVAALLYLVTEELLVEAHEVPETSFQTAMFFVGFIVLLIIEMRM